MKKKGLWIIVILLVLVLGVAVCGFLLPYLLAQSTMQTSGGLTMEQQAEGGWLLSWEEAEDADLYRVEILNSGDGQILFRNFAEESASMLLPQLPENMELTICVTSGARFRTLLGESTRFSEESLEATAQFKAMDFGVLDFAVNGDDKTVSVSVQYPEDAQWQCRLFDSAGGLIKEETFAEATAVLQFGDGAIPIPEEGADYSLRARAFRQGDGVVMYSVASNDLRITQTGLQFRTLDPVLEETSKNTISITWDETRGSVYEVQQLDAQTGSWNTVSQVPQGEERRYSAWLEAGNTYEYRVVAVDDQGEELVVSEPMTFETRDLVQYATVWPTRDMAVYATAAYGQVIGTAKAGTAYCVLEEKNNMFAVRIGDDIGYIDSNYCMINLPDYLGGLCNYNITNSVYSIYTIHEFAIADVTGVVTAGYEDVYQEDGSFLVPLIYPTAKKLMNAAKTAQEQGYRLKIYDSFRPYIATREIYDLTSLIVNDPVPETTYTGVSRDTMELPGPRDGATELTLGWLMTGRNFVQSSFLAKNGSAHNLGIALDLTLEDLETGEEIAMQSSMHDLSQYSVLSENNEMADVLGNIMHRAGFAGLISEWWHFQDDNTKSSLGLNSVAEGFDAECWVKDDTGWKYRTAKGGWHAGETVTISGTQYTFDANGYVVE